jgi:hypothetical protein
VLPSEKCLPLLRRLEVLSEVQGARIVRSGGMKGIITDAPPARSTSNIEVLEGGRSGASGCEVEGGGGHALGGGGSFSETVETLKRQRDKGMRFKNSLAMSLDRHVSIERMLTYADVC